MVRASVIVVGLQGSPADEWLIRYAANLAGLSDARLQAVHVRALDNLDPATERLEKDRRLLAELGGTLLEVRSGDPASGLIEAARGAGACQLVIGSRHRWRLSRLLNGSTVTEQVLRAAGDLPVQVVNVGRPDKTSREGRRQHIGPGSAQSLKPSGTGRRQIRPTRHTRSPYPHRSGPQEGFGIFARRPSPRTPDGTGL